MAKNNFKGIIGLANIYTDTNKKRRKKNIDNFNKSLIEFAKKFKIDKE